MKFPTLNTFLFKWVVCAVVPLLFYCQSPVEPPNTDSDAIEFESVWQYCKALSIYQDSSIYDGRIPSDPFAFNQPRDILLAIRDTLKGYNYYTDYDWAAINSPQPPLPSPAVAAVAFADSSPVFLDSLTPSTALLTITTFEGAFSGAVFDDFLIHASAASRFRNIIVNVRHNPGGLIDEADSIIAALDTAGTRYLLARQRDKDPVTKNYVTLNWHAWTTTHGPIFGFGNKHFAVLMDTMTASASEIMVAGLYEGAIARGMTMPIIGTRSYGKGMGQTQISRRTRKPLIITSLLFKGISSRIGDYHRKGILPDTVPPAIRQQGDSAFSDDWRRQIFFAVKILDSTASPGSINYPVEHHPAPAPLSKVLPCYYNVITENDTMLPRAH